jgi:hypothetical protein
MITPKTLQQQTEAEAKATQETSQAFYDDNDLGGTLVAKSLQLNVWSACGIPIGRSDEFDNGTPEKKTNFNIFSALAAGKKPVGVTYVQAWETEYSKIYP